MNCIQASTLYDLQVTCGSVNQLAAVLDYMGVIRFLKTSLWNPESWGAIHKGTGQVHDVCFFCLLYLQVPMIDLLYS